MSDGNSKIEGYVIKMKEDDGEWMDVGRAKSLDKDFKVNDLTPGKKYSFAVFAKNAVGDGPTIELKETIVLKKKAG